MKVMKFGGTSVGSVESILSLKKIVDSENQQVVVVVSALSGITDKLLETAYAAQKGDEAYRDMFAEIAQRHLDMIDSIVQKDRQPELLKYTQDLLEELKSIYLGVFLIHDLTHKTISTIVSYGERLSSRIVTALFDDAQWMDARTFIKTETKHDRYFLDSEKTSGLVRNAFSEQHKVCVVPGFISTDAATGEITNLGRGGSDYTAAIIAAELNASQLEIWTDVDGFMTADPRVISTAYTISELSYTEAMELCNFGAKVIYPPTIYPVCKKNIPIYVKNTMNPENPGTVIKQKVGLNDKPIKGISSISGTSLITVAGLSMVGVIGVNRRIFSCLAENGISVFLVSQASSENNTSIGVRDEDCPTAIQVLNKEFSKEIKTGAMFPMSAESNLATVAIVGENMKHTTGIAGKLFGSLGRAGINVIACAQGASETNISFVVDSRYLRKTLNTLHDSFFLSEYQVLNLFVCGVGTVGGNLLEQIRSQYEELKKTRRLKLNVVGIASSKKAIYNRDGLDLANYKDELNQSAPSNINLLMENIIAMNIFNSVFVDCTASAEVAGQYKNLLEHNISVVAANKIAASSAYADYKVLKETALKKSVKFLFETNVGAGLPIINTINDMKNSGDKILKIEAVLSGTLNFIFNEISADVPFSETVRRAKEQGYSEPDPRIDLSGKDVIRKLVILSREAGYVVEQEDVEKKLFVPDKFFTGTLDEFWKNLPELDADFETRRKKLEAENKRWRFIAKMEMGKTSVSLEAVEDKHPFYQLEGSNNIILFTTERYNKYPMQIQGYGAGAGVTAAGVFADIMRIANI